MNSEQHDQPTDDTLKNEALEKEKEYQESQSNGKTSDDPTAHRNVGARGYTERSNQKDQLENLHISGSEISPQGGNNHETVGEQAQGPGFTEEGSYELGYVRTREQKFGDAAPSGPVTPPADAAPSE